jgi:hypothetical protein
MMDGVKTCDCELFQSPLRILGRRSKKVKNHYRRRIAVGLWREIHIDI